MNAKLRSEKIIFAKLKEKLEIIILKHKEYEEEHAQNN